MTKSSSPAPEHVPCFGPASDETELTACLDEAAAALQDDGVALIRGLDDVGDRLEAIVQTITGEQTLSYEGGATPRSHIRGRVYTSTDFPASESIDMHSEMA